jgi:cell division protein FtsA
MVLAVGGNHLTQDISVGLRVNPEVAEQVKKQYGHAIKSEVGEDEFFTLRAYGEEQPVQVSRRDLAHIIEARMEETFSLLLQEIKRSGYDGLLPAGMVLTGGTSQLPGIRTLASRVLGMPVRLARPENLVGLVDQLQSPSYSTSVGLLKWAELMEETMAPAKGRRASRSKNANPGVPVINWKDVGEFLKRLLPYE